MINRDQIAENEIRKILEEHPKGMSKDHLITLLEKRGVTTRATFYKHLPEYCDPKSANLIKLKPHGKRELCFPTSYTLITAEFHRKLVVLYDLLDLIAKNPDIGNVLIVSKKGKRKKAITRTEIFHKRQVIEFVDPQKFLSKNKTLRNKIKINVVPIGARNSILKELPYYLVNRINSLYRSHSDKLKKELVKELFPVINKCIEIFSNSINKKSLSITGIYGALIKRIDSLEDFSVGPYEVKVSPDIISSRKFEDNVLYYFFLVSLNFSKYFHIDDTKEQKVILNFIHEFFPQQRSIFWTKRT